MEKIFDGCTEELKKSTCEITDTISSITEVLRSLASDLRGAKKNSVFEKIKEFNDWNRVIKSRLKKIENYKEEYCRVLRKSCDPNVVAEDIDPIIMEFFIEYICIKTDMSQVELDLDDFNNKMDFASTELDLAKASLKKQIAEIYERDKDFVDKIKIVAKHFSVSK